MPSKKTSKLSKALADLGLSKKDIEYATTNKRSDIGKPRHKHSITWFMNEYGLTFAQARKQRLKFLEEKQ
ncbi:MAG: hypothetical protein ACOVJ8_07185 [Sediminibacterium sp.]